MNRTSTIALIALAAPVLAYAGGWTEIPVGLWLGEELAWAQPLHPSSPDVAEIMDDYDTPPRAEWCGPSGLLSTPTQAQCADYASDLQDWMMDFTGATSTSNLPSYSNPPTYCGGC